MKTKFLLALFISLSVSVAPLLADSPLTSTPINIAYEEEKIVKLAGESNGVLTQELSDYLIDPNNPIALKAALINKLGWDINGKNNAAIFLTHLSEKKGYKNLKRVLKKADAGVLISLAYLKALDNYFEVDEAIAIAEKALSKDKKSYTANIITALIKAQKAMDTNFCQAYKFAHDVRENKSLNDDLNKEAVNIIFDYMDLYKKGC